MIVTRNGKPAVKLVVVEPKRKSRKNIIGSGIGKIWVSLEYRSPEAKDGIADMFVAAEEFL